MHVAGTDALVPGPFVDVNGLAVEPVLSGADGTTPVEGQQQRRPPAKRGRKRKDAVRARRHSFMPAPGSFCASRPPALFWRLARSVLYLLFELPGNSAHASPHRQVTSLFLLTPVSPSAAGGRGGHPGAAVRARGARTPQWFSPSLHSQLAAQRAWPNSGCPIHHHPLPSIRRATGRARRGAGSGRRRTQPSSSRRCAHSLRWGVPLSASLDAGKQPPDVASMTPCAAEVAAPHSLLVSGAGS